MLLVSETRFTSFETVLVMLHQISLWSWGRAISYWLQALRDKKRWWSSWWKNHIESKWIHTICPALTPGDIFQWCPGLWCQTFDWPIVFFCVYHLPHSSFLVDNSLIMLLLSLFKLPNRVILVGDLNARIYTGKTSHTHQHHPSNQSSSRSYGMPLNFEMLGYQIIKVCHITPHFST